MLMESIKVTDILELKTYRQPGPGYARITLLRGQCFYARAVGGALQEWERVEEEQALLMFEKFVAFQEKLGSKLL